MRPSTASREQAAMGDEEVPTQVSGRPLADLGARWLVGQQLPELRLRQRALRGAQRGQDTSQRRVLLCERARSERHAARPCARARSHSLCKVSRPRCAPRRARWRRRSSGSCCPTSQRAPRSPPCSVPPEQVDPLGT